MLPFLRRKPSRADPVPPDPLDTTLLSFSQTDHFSIRDACEGVQIFGGIGSGKTSGSGAALATSMLQKGFGGVVLTSKPDETNLWLRYASWTGRTEDVVLFGQRGEHTFNFMEYECTRPGAGGGITENLVRLFDVLVEVANRGSGQSGENEAFWRGEQRKLLRNAIDLLKLSGTPLTLPNIYDVVVSAAYSREEFDSESWRSTSFCCDALRAAWQRDEAQAIPEADRFDLQLCSDYWSKEYPQMSEKTRGTVVSMFTGMADVFLRGLLRKLYCSGTSLTPEDTLEGKIIILDLPQKLFNEVGVYAQVLFKYLWQRAVERRQVRSHSRPVFLWADEAQHFINEHDVTFQTTSRSSRACTVYLTQNLPNYLYALGGSARAQSLVDSLLGNLVTKIFHNNTCSRTNQYAADLFARDWQSRDTYSSNTQNGQSSFGNSITQQLEYAIQPREFSTLLKGGPQNNFCVEALIHQGGKTFRTSGGNALRTVFSQPR